METGSIIGGASSGALIAIIAYLAWHGIRHIAARKIVYDYVLSKKRHEPGMVIFRHPSNKFATGVINGKSAQSGAVIFTLSPHEIVFYPIKVPIEAPVAFEPADIRWFGRPAAHSAGLHEVWLHVERKREWVLVKLCLERSIMEDFICAIKPLVPLELLISYQKRLSYIEYGPAAAQPAEQDIHGAWSLEAAVSLYLMPRYLLILHDDAVQSLIPLQSVQQISALRRLDAPTANGLVRFQTPESPYAFALKDYETFATALAEAAKRTLEAPVMQKQKGKDGEWDDMD